MNLENFEKDTVDLKSTVGADGWDKRDTEYQDAEGEFKSDVLYWTEHGPFMLATPWND